MGSFFRHIYLYFSGFFCRPSNSVVIFNSHFISKFDAEYEVLDKQLNSLNRWVEFINLPAAIDKIKSREAIEKPFATFTYDDGFEECYTKIAPTLEKYGVRGTFFINPGFVNGDKAYCLDFTENKVLTPGKKSMTWEQIIDLDRRGHIIGCHTYDHLRLDIVDANTIESQLLRSKTEIERRLGKSCDYFAYPYGQESDLSEVALTIASPHYKYIFSGCNFRNYYTFNGRVFNRRHIEGDWPIQHINYFLSFKRKHEDN